MRCRSWPWASRFPTATCASPTTQDAEVPEGHVGHILISGDNVTKGYFENPDANAKGFTAPDQGIAGCAPAISE